MDKLKEIITKKIIQDKEDKIDYYNQKIEEVVYNDNPAYLLSLIISLYENESERKDVAIELMRNTLTNDFFRNAEIKRTFYWISFVSKKYKVNFSTTNKGIEIEYCATTNPYEIKKKNRVSSKEEQKLYVLIESTKEYLNNKTYNNLKKLSEVYFKDEKKNIFYKLYQTHKKCDKLFLEELEKRRILNEERKQTIELSLRLYKMKEEEAMKFMKSLSDLDIYKESNWNIYLVNEVERRQV